MKIIDVIPLLKTIVVGDETLTYFSADDNLRPGALVEAPVRRRRVPAVVMDVRDVRDERFRLRKGIAFELKAIGKILSPGPVIHPLDIDLARWIGEYYWAPPAFTLRLFFPPYMWEGRDLPEIAPVPDDMLARVPQNPPALKRKTVALPIAERWQAYVRAVQQLQGEGSQTLLLFPDNTTARRFYETHKRELPGAVRYTSETSTRQHFRTWEDIRLGRATVIIGTRGAVFAPMARPQLIIVDEPSAPSYKSSLRRPFYNVAAIAEERARRFGIPLLAGDDLFLPTDGRSARTVSATLSGVPPITLLSLATDRDETKNTMTVPLISALKESIRQESQALIFMNRRGAAPLTMCEECGYVFRCPNCDAPLVLHEEHEKTYVCHHCRHKTAPIEQCPNCQSWRMRVFRGGTQQIENELHTHFPETPVFRLDSDAAPSMRTERAIISEFLATRPAILVGTQMAEKLRLPGLTPQEPLGLIAMANIDPLLKLPDFNMRERVLRSIMHLRQIGHEAFYIQTYNADDPFLALAAIGDVAAFAKDEMHLREQLGYPPFSQFIKLQLRERNNKRALEKAEILHKNLEALGIEQQRIKLLGPVPGFIARERGRYVWQILLQLPAGIAPQSRNAILDNVPIEWEIDVDPESIL